VQRSRPDSIAASCWLSIELFGRRHALEPTL
jgi:hypothetical protein